jgi:hypothetical protein
MPKNITEIFLEEILGEKEGIAYVPTKDVKTGHFQQYFFAWPAQKREIITHLLLECKTKEVYLAPSLFKEMSSKKTDWLGSHFVWVEFDGNALEVNRNGIPEPTLVIQSSTEGHEHWYWKLKSGTQGRFYGPLGRDTMRAGGRYGSQSEITESSGMKILKDLRNSQKTLRLI